jgi:hypothetical protein
VGFNVTGVEYSVAVSKELLFFKSHFIYNLYKYIRQIV